jgi:hypothetical protein
MNRLRIVSLSALLVVLASCWFLRVGDNAVRIKGELVPDEPSNICCTLELRSYSTESLPRVLSVSGSFDRTFTVSPWPQYYYVVIFCPDAGEVFRSAKFHVRDTTHFTTPLDLGLIPVKTSRSANDDME